MKQHSSLPGPTDGKRRRQATSSLLVHKARRCTSSGRKCFVPSTILPSSHPQGYLPYTFTAYGVCTVARLVCIRLARHIFSIYGRDMLIYSETGWARTGTCCDQILLLITRCYRTILGHSQLAAQHLFKWKKRQLTGVQECNVTSQLVSNL